MTKLTCLLILLPLATLAKIDTHPLKKEGPSPKLAEAQELRKAIEKKNILHIKKQLEILKNRNEARYQSKKENKTL